MKTKQRFLLQEEAHISRREVISLVASLPVFLKAFSQGSKYMQIPLPKLILILHLQNQKTISSLNIVKTSFNIQMDKSFIVPNRKEQILRHFHRKVWTTLYPFYTYSNCQPYLSRKTPAPQEPILRCKQTSLKYFRAITMCSAFPLSAFMT